MESVLGRYRNLVILVGVLFLQVLGLAVQVKRSGNDAEHTRLIRIWAVDAVTPLERILIWAQRGTGDIWHNYFYLRGVRSENRQLKDQIEQMRLEQVRLSEDAAQARRLQALLSFKEQFIAKTVAAQVIGTSGTDLSIYIDKGENAGLKRDMAVITSDGIVGKVLVVYPSVSQVLLINDQSSGVGALIEKTRLQGVIHGTANGEVVLERVMSDEEVPLGETVLTSGGDRIFPKGLPVGTVVKVGKGKDLFLNIKIKPAASLSKLEEVLVLVEKQDRAATPDEAARVRAADILAQRLPSVPDKPADAKTAEGAALAGKPAVANPKPKGTGTTSQTTSSQNTGSQTMSSQTMGSQTKKPSDTSSIQVVPGAAPAAKPASISPAAPKSATAPTGTDAKPAPTENKPASDAGAPKQKTPEAPKPVAPSSAPPPNPQTSAGDGPQ